MDSDHALAMESPCVVLVVDDYPENLLSMQALLARKDWQVLTARSGVEALAALLEHEVDLVLLDVQMPEMDGFEVARLMRGSQRTQSTPIVFLTAMEKSEAAVLKGYDSGAVDYVFKPFDPQILKPKVQALVDQQRDRRVLRRMAEELAAAQAFNASILENAAEGVLVVDEAGAVTFANPAISQLLQTSVDDLAGAAVLDLVELPDAPPWRASPFYQAHRSRQTYRAHDAWLRTSLGQRVPVALSCAPLPVERRGMVLTVLDMSVVSHLHQQLEHQAITDPLTGLLNRRGFYQAAETALLRCERSEKVQALMYMDLDGFKRINDALGHEAGDRILRWVAEQLKDCLGSQALLGRMGGDEFTALFDSLNYAEHAACLAEQLLERLASQEHLDGRELTLGVSIGIATYPECGNSVEGLVRAADTAMYAAKTAGRHQYRFYDNELNGRARSRLMLENSVRAAIEQEEFTLVYQPQVAFDGSLRGFEALLRWQHPSAGDVPPGLFIPLLEEVRLIHRLASWIYGRGAAQRRDWQTCFADELVLGISLSRAQFNQPNLVDELSRVIVLQGLQPAQLEVEVAETSLTHDIDAAAVQVRKLKALGVRVALDDFGAGDCALRMLRDLPIDTVKLDRHWLARLPDSVVDAALMRSVIAVCVEHGITVVAEGVEHIAQAAWLQANGCTYLQGFLVARPMTAADARLFTTPGPWPWPSAQVSS